MAGITFVIILFVVFVGGGWLAGRILGNILFPKGGHEARGYIDKSVHHHHHYHDSRTVNQYFENEKTTTITRGSRNDRL